MLFTIALISACSASAQRIVEKRLPLSRRDHEIFVGVFHGATRVLLRAARRLADRFRDEVLEACRGNAMMRLIDPRVRVQTGIDHDPVNKVIHYSGDAMDTTQELVNSFATAGFGVADGIGARRVCGWR